MDVSAQYSKYIFSDFFLEISSLYDIHYHISQVSKNITILHITIFMENSQNITISQLPYFNMVILRHYHIFQIW